jgi:cyclic beta-1,2-glucan synthetase
VSRQPCGAAPDAGEVVFYPHLAEFHRRDGDLAIRVEVVVAPADDIEIRHVTIINDGDRPRRLTITTCGEVVLAKAADHERHPAFSKLFVHSECIPALDGLLFLRRPRSPAERPPVLIHRLVSDDPHLQFHGTETDRAAFVGRGRTYRDPIGAVRSGPTSSGFTLDPIVALQISADVGPSASVQFAFVTAVSGSRESVLELAERYQTMNAVEWVMAEAEAEAGRELQRFGIEPAHMAAMQTLASLLVYRHRALRCTAETIVANRLGEPRLWGLGISGDLPIVLVKLRTADDIDLLRDLARAHAFWRRRGLRFDLVVLRHGASGYGEPIGEKLRALLLGLGTREQLGQQSGIHFLSSDHIGEDERRLLDVVANVVLDTDRGSLGSQLARVHEEASPLPGFVPSGALEAGGDEAVTLERPAGLLFDNGLGGFSGDGREYVIHLGPGDTTPAPWCNVLANPDFGTLVTESGGGFTWAGNSGEHRLTPWTNDPVSDPAGEALYVRDEETAAIWTPTPQPAGAGVAHQVRYGAGYARWRSARHGLSQDLLVFVAPDEPVKVVRLRVRNHRHRPRRLTVTYYAEWILGGSRQQSNCALVPEYEASQRAMLVRNPWQGEFANRVAFLTASRNPHGITSDRAEFIGREGTLRRPAALERWGLTGIVSPGRDPCAAYQVHLDLAADAEDEVVFVLGEGRDREHALELVARWREPGAADAAWDRLGRFWDDRLDIVHVETPDRAMNVMLNRWLLYQAIASRMFGRTGFYQSSGAIGFRDQLQDALALVMVEPARCRAHLLDCAARQFEQGDVLHWWHPPARGVRTRCSDDLLWLPFAVAHYMTATGDATVLEEHVPFLKSRPLVESEDDLYAVFEAGDQSGTLFEHCERALERGLTRGAHGLPLIGSGDWNDGMNRVGRQGRGESVWLAWFAIATANAFARICQQRGTAEQADRWRRRARELAHAAEEHGWDGEWYRRAFDDQGRPWGSQDNTECRIDSIAQSWAVMSGGGAPTRAKDAVGALERELIDWDARLVRLLAPPFEAGGRDPGYIKAYPPGIRENGGQYTHAAIWAGWAFADLGDGERAARVFDLLSPIGHARDRAAVQRYRVEPYVVAADVGGVSPHLGRGGWTWYTGSAAWMWRLGVERILGVRPEAGGVRIEPCLPRAWRRVDVTIRRPGGGLSITIENPDGAETGIAARWVDGVASDNAVVAFPVDGRERRVVVRLGPADRSGPRGDQNVRAGSAAAA